MVERWTAEEKAREQLWAALTGLCFEAPSALGCGRSVGGNSVRVYIVSGKEASGAGKLRGAE